MVKKIFARPAEERVYAYFKDLLYSFNPDKYHELTNRTYWQGTKYFIKTIILSSLILGLILGSQLITFKGSLDTELEKLNSLELKGNLTKPISIDKYKILFANEANYTNQNVLITDKEFIRKPTLCALLKPTCFFVGEPIKTEYSNLHAHRKELSRFLFILSILLFPGIMLIFILFFFIKSGIIIILLSSLAYFIIKAMNYQLRYKRVMLAAVFSSTALIIAEPINILLWNLYYVHVIFSFFLFMVCLLLLCEKKHRYRDI